MLSSVNGVVGRKLMWKEVFVSAVVTSQKSGANQTSARTTERTVKNTAPGRMILFFFMLPPPLTSSGSFDPG